MVSGKCLLQLPYCCSLFLGEELSVSCMNSLGSCLTVTLQTVYAVVQKQHRYCVRSHFCMGMNTFATESILLYTNFTKPC